MGEKTVKGRGGNGEKTSGRILHAHSFVCALILTILVKSRWQSFEDKLWMWFVIPVGRATYNERPWPIAQDF